MNEQELRQEIINACKFLQEKKLIARTWGNVSARLNDKEFIITPSGLSYDLTKPEDLVIVNIDDCSYDENQRKPSSEKKVHASAYKARKDINFIVHTHQHFASAICAEEKDVTLPNGTLVPCAKYGMPSTSKLQKNCEDTFNNNKSSNIFLMAKHGTVTFGKTMKEALDNAVVLEEECEKLFNNRVKDFKILKNMKPYLDDYAQMFPLQDGEDAEAIELVKNKNAAAMLYATSAKPLSFFDSKIQHIVYKMKYSKLKNGG